MEGLILGLAMSYHLGFSGSYNEIHPYIEYQQNNLSIGAYYNSEERVSAYASLNFNISHNISVNVGIVSGYPEITKYEEYDILPFVKFNYHLDDRTKIFATPAAERQYDQSMNYGAVIGIAFDL